MQAPNPSQKHLVIALQISFDAKITTKKEAELVLGCAVMQQ